MRDSLDLATYANLACMLRAEVDGAIWLSDDLEEGRFYERCAHTKARVVAAEGLAIKIFETLRQRGLEGIVATVKDFDNEMLDDDVFCPDVGDVASLLIGASCCDRVLEEVVGSYWLRACEKEGTSLRERAVTIAWILRQLGQATEGVDSLQFSESIINWNDLTISKTGLEKVSTKIYYERVEEVEAMAMELSFEARLRECSGMQAIKIICAATRHYRPRGLSAISQIDLSGFLGMLRLSFDLNEIEKDAMFWRMLRWQRLNRRFPLLRQWRLLDPLQVVWDQRYWEVDLRMMLEQRIGHDVIAAFKMDLDNFKGVNESLGHTGGDEAISLYCRVVKDSLARVGEVYRRGGDEVVAFAPGVSAQSALDLAEDLRVRIQEVFADWGRQRGLSEPPTASIGVITAGVGSDWRQVVQYMDKAQQRAKEEGKNRVILLDLCSALG